MLSEATQQIVNLVAGGVLWVFFLLGLLVQHTKVPRTVQAGRMIALRAAYISPFVFAGAFTLTIVYGPVEIRWKYIWAGFFASWLLLAIPYRLLARAMRVRGTWKDSLGGRE